MNLIKIKDFIFLYFTNLYSQQKTCTFYKPNLFRHNIIVIGVLYGGMHLKKLFKVFYTFYSEVPHDLIREAKGGEVNLDMEDHRAEDYVKPKHSVKAFSGAGHMLGR